MKIKGAIFDMDGTIIDSLMFWDYLWPKIGEKYMGDINFRPSDELSKKFRTTIFKDAMAFFREYYKLPVSFDEFYSFASSGILDFYKNIATAKKGADKLLAFLKEKGVKIYLASATTMPEIKFTLECHGLLEYFDDIFSCADIGVSKDKPDIYLLAMQKMGFSANEICVIEDSFVALETAKKVGFQTIGVYDAGNFDQERLKKSADIYLEKGKTLDELIEIFDI